MPVCCVPGCSSSTGSIRGVSFYRIPKIDKISPEYVEISTKRQMGWLAAINQSDYNVCKNYRVCGLHFDSGIKAKLTDVENPNRLPHLYLNEREDSDIHYDEDVHGDAIPDGPEADFFCVEDYGDAAKIDFQKAAEAHKTITSQTNVSITNLSSEVLQMYEEKIRLKEKLHGIIEFYNYEGAL